MPRPGSLRSRRSTWLQRQSKGAEQVADIGKIGVVGAGLMGAGIAEVCARAGLDVMVHEVNSTTVAAGRSRIETSLARAVRAGKLTDAERDAAFGHIRFTTDLGELADRHLVVEAIAEHEPTKVEVFAALDKVVTGEDTIFASNTSSIPITKLAMATHRPRNVMGIHFFNPVPVMALVELVPSLLTADVTRQRAEEFVTGVLGKTVVRCPDRAGFV